MKLHLSESIVDEIIDKQRRTFYPDPGCFLCRRLIMQTGFCSYTTSSWRKKRYNFTSRRYLYCIAWSSLIGY